MEQTVGDGIQVVNFHRDTFRLIPSGLRYDGGIYNYWKSDGEFVYYKPAPPNDTRPGTGEEEDLCEFGTEHKECYFCGQPRTVRFNEHYTFCPNCSAIYSRMLIQDDTTDCIHFNKIGDTAIVTERRPKRSFSDKSRDKLHVVHTCGMMRCSKCGDHNIHVDGW